MVKEGDIVGMNKLVLNQSSMWRNLIKTIDPGLAAKYPSAELTPNGHWRIRCQCPQCNHWNQHNGGNGAAASTGALLCHECRYQYTITLKGKDE